MHIINHDLLITTCKVDHGIVHDLEILWEDDISYHLRLSFPMDFFWKNDDDKMICKTTVCDNLVIV